MPSVVVHEVFHGGLNAKFGRYMKHLMTTDVGIEIVMKRLTEFHVVVYTHTCESLGDRCIGF